MKDTILIFSGGYLPGARFGGPVTSLKNFADAFCYKYNIKVITLDHDYKCKERYSGINNGWNQVGSADVLYLSNSECNYSNFKRIIKTEKPSFCYLSGTITSYFGFNEYVIEICNEIRVPVILVLRGDLCDDALNIKKVKKMVAIVLCRLKKAFEKVYFQSTFAEETTNLIKYFNINESRIFEAPNIPANIQITRIREKRKGEIKLIFISRIAFIKNLLDAIKSVNGTKSKVVFDIYGPLEDIKYWLECKETIRLAPQNVNINYKGALDLNVAKNIFQEYDAFLFETRSENYGHVIAESLLCGCPVILSKKTTPWDDLDKRAGFTAELGDINEFARLIDLIANMEGKVYSDLRKSTRSYALEKTKFNNIIEQYQKMFNIVTNSFNNVHK